MTLVRLMIVMKYFARHMIQEMIQGAELKLAPRPHQGSRSSWSVESSRQWARTAMMQNHSLVPGYFAAWSRTIPFNFKTKKIFAESGLQTLQIFGSMRVATRDIASICGNIFMRSKMLAVYSQNWHFLDPSDTDMPSTALDTFLTCLALPPATDLRNHPQKSRDLYLASKNCHKNTTPSTVARIYLSISTFRFKWGFTFPHTLSSCKQWKHHSKRRNCLWKGICQIKGAKTIRKSSLQLG